ncbi:hypothetical protein FE257_006284 [Aspergillus nanangensis]|uniref:Phosphoglycerate mutase family protein n=1 Tax=Aspergillus nanangensis TaxID=2582783 RepID=A0AAD4CPP3_ASPNN|nr:hypothetical protein FE257_006284 [Aspergillus nanangensis]
MGNPPATIIIARHGARLDAADKDWHLSAVNPYDPPLSYGGWLQGRALGARIFSTLQPEDGQPKRKRRFIIHSSPYLRCVQTSIAIGSGISQHAAESDSAAPSTTSSSNPAPDLDPRCLLRVDAILGEWLTPSYFDHITPPPKSEKLVSAAKAELLRREESVIPSADTTTIVRPSTGHFPGGWASLTSAPAEINNEDEKGSEVGKISKGRARAGSYDTLASADTPRTRRMLTKINTNLPTIPDGVYMPPTPSYAISRSHPIPAGYVAHARDACVKIDYQWDSMRDPQNWGDGSQLEEEWSAMHDRFHTALEQIIAWYGEHDAVASVGSRRRHSQVPETGQNGLGHDDPDDQTETVVIIVTHGAGVNAMIGALMAEPAFVDIGTASLTLAVRKDRDVTTTQPSLTGGPVGPPVDSEPPSLLQSYDLQLVASTEHLRPATHLSTSVLSSPNSLVSPSIPSARHRVSSRSSMSQSSFIIGPSSTSGPGTRPWSMMRPSTAPRGATGLWGSMSTTEPADDFLPNFGSAFSTAPLPPNNDGGLNKGTVPDGGWVPHLPQRTASQRGLWGGSPLNPGAESAVKRRWTVTERRV